MSEGGMEIGVVTFPGSDRAEHLVNSLGNRGAGRLLEEVAIIEHHDDGKFNVRSFAPGATKGQHIAVGALVGGMVGVLLGPVGLLGMIGGASVGALMRGRNPHEIDLSDTFVEKIRASLPNGSSAVLIIGEKEAVDQLMGEIHAEGAISKAELREPLTDEQVQVLKRALEEASSASDD